MFNPAAKTVIFIIRIYKKVISPLKGRTCRFYPSCSQYAVDAINKYGLIKGLFLSSKRLLKCHPFNPGGFDPVE